MGNVVSEKLLELLREETVLTSGLLFVAVFLLCYMIFRRSDLPPGPMKIPLIGNAWWLLKQQKEKKRPPVALKEATQKYGDVIHIQLGQENLVFIHGYDAIHEAFVKQSEDFSARPSRLMKDIQKGGFGVVMESGQRWKIMRKFTLQSLKDFGVGKTSLEDKIVVEIEAATAFLNEVKGNPTDIRLLTSMIITNVIYGIVFGRR